MKTEPFDPALTDAYLLEAIKKIGSTLNDVEKMELLQRKYGISFDNAQKAVNYFK